MLRLLRSATAFLVVLVLGCAVTANAAESEEEIVAKIVGKRVSDFPKQDDFSSPEAAYATVNRHIASGTGNWRDLSCSRLRKKFSDSDARITLPSADKANLYRHAKIVETRTYRRVYAQVTGRMNRTRRPYETRTFELEEGRWLNSGNSAFATLDEAINKFEQLIRLREDLAKIQPRPPVADPERVLSRHLAFLRDQGQPPKDYILQALGRHRLVAIGEIHHRPNYWRLNGEVVQDARFAESTGTIYLELPMHGQSLIDEFLAARELNTTPVISVLRDNLWTGWPDQAMLGFFITVWQTNQRLDEDNRLRIVLVDMKRPWRELIRDGNLRKYDTDRDKLMAENILRDMDDQYDRRNVLLIVGFAHIENLRVAGQEQPIANAGRHLRERLGDSFFTIVQHGPVIANAGDVSGRTCLGLFDAAFEANGNAPVAFPLDIGPFGEHRYDLNGDQCERSTSRFAEAFNGYLYMGPLEVEVFSPLISGFYADAFVREVDQRHRLLCGVGLQEKWGLAALDGQSFEQWMRRSWGQPRQWRYRLGPTTAWQQGDQGGKYALSVDYPSPACAGADPKTRDGVVRLVENCFRHNFRDITARDNVKWGSLTIDKKGNASISYQCEATTHNGEVRPLKVVFTFAPNGGLVSLKDMSD